jgi:MFS family permease
MDAVELQPSGSAISFCKAHLSAKTPFAARKHYHYFIAVIINRRFFALSCLAGVGRLQNSTALIAIVAASQASGFSILQSSIIGGSLFLAAALSALWKGRLVDRQGRGVVIQQTCLLALAYGALIAAFIWGGHWSLAAAGAVLLGSVRLNPGALQQALWSDLHPEKDLLARALSWESTVSFGAQIAGPLVAVAAIWLFGGYGGLAVGGALTVLSMLIWGRLAPASEAQTDVSKSKILWSALPAVASLLLLAFSAGMLQGIVLNQSGQPLLIAIYTIGAGSVGFYFFRRALPVEWQRLALSLSPLLLALMAFFWGTVALIPALFVAGGLFAAGSLAANLQIKSQAPQERINEAFSLPVIAVPLGMSLGILGSGALLAINWQPVAIALSLLLTLLTIASSFGWQKYLAGDRQVFPESPRR